MNRETARAWFEPQSILVVGASLKRVTLGNIFLQRQLQFGYPGRLHVLHPEAAEISGIRCVRSLNDVPTPVDFAYVVIPAGEVVPFLAAAAGRIRVAQIVSSGFRETGEAGRSLEADMVRVARAGGIRVVGPNCMGSYSPRGGLTMVEGAPHEPGDIAVLSQSGVAAGDVIKLGGFMGGRFSQVLSIGNCADVGAVELYDYFVEDPDTRAVGMYIEGPEDGTAFIEVARKAERFKPTVVLKGGMTDQGRRSVSSHTGALATDERIWHGMAAQLGLTLKTSIEDFVGSLVGFSLWQRGAAPVGRRSCLVGPGGVLSVLGTDLFRRHGLDVVEIGPQTLASLEALRLPPGSSLHNPVDTPVGVMQAEGGHAFGRIFRIVAGASEMDWFVAHISVQNLFSYLGDPETALRTAVADFTEIAREFRDRARWCLVLRTNGDPALELIRARYRELAAASGVPVFAGLEGAASAILDFVRWAEHRDRASNA